MGINNKATASRFVYFEFLSSHSRVSLVYSQNRIMSRRSIGTILADRRIEEEMKRAHELRQQYINTTTMYRIQAAKVLDMVIEHKTAHEARVAERAKVGGKELVLPEEEERRR